jgi:hypothetical protein
MREVAQRLGSFLQQLRDGAPVSTIALRLEVRKLGFSCFFPQSWRLVYSRATPVLLVTTLRHTTGRVSLALTTRTTRTTMTCRRLAFWRVCTSHRRKTCWFGCMGEPPLPPEEIRHYAPAVLTGTDLRGARPCHEIISGKRSLWGLAGSISRSTSR